MDRTVEVEEVVLKGNEVVSTGETADRAVVGAAADIEEDLTARTGASTMLAPEEVDMPTMMAADRTVRGMGELWITDFVKVACSYSSHCTHTARRGIWCHVYLHFIFSRDMRSNMAYIAFASLFGGLV